MQASENPKANGIFTVSADNPDTGRGGANPASRHRRGPTPMIVLTEPVAMVDDFYGLTEKPFQLTPDPAFYFPSATHRKALSYLGYGLRQGEGYVVITGEVGSGKSTLVAHLTSTIDPERLTVAHIVIGEFDEDEVAPKLGQALGLDSTGHDKASVLGAIEGFLHDGARAGRRTLLIVDDSQNLSVAALEELRVLSTFQLGSHPLLQTLLLGRPEFRATLQTHPALEQLRRRVIAMHHLDPMEQGEIEPYIKHRLGRVGWDANPQFDQRVFLDLHAASSGNPRRVNQIASRLLVLGAVEERSRIDSAMLRAVVDEMTSTTAFPEAAPNPIPKLTALAPASVPAKPEPRIDQAMLESLLAARDVQIAELQQAVVELAGQQDISATAAVRPEFEALRDQITRLELKLTEQERTLRETLTMLIEWVEAETGHIKAA
jgi:general secretion pathway protein A